MGPQKFSDPDSLLMLQRQLTIAVLAGAFIFLMLYIGAYFADILHVMVISLMLSYLVINVVDFLDKTLKNRAISVALVYIALLTTGIVAAIFVVPAMVYQIAQLVSSTVDSIPEALHRMLDAMAPIEQRFRASQINIKMADVVGDLIANLPKPDPGAIVTRLTDMAMGTMTWVVYSISISVVTFYFLLDGHRMKGSIIGLFPRAHRPVLDKLATDMDQNLQAFFRGQIVLGLLFGALMMGVYFVCGVQYALLLGVFLGICEVLPVIGPPLGFAPAVIAVAVHGSYLPGARFIQILILAGIFMVLQQIKDNVVGPKYIGNVIGLHPVLIFVAIMIGAKLDGVVGIIVSLPVACVITVLVNHIKQTNDQTVVETGEDIVPIDAQQPSALPPAGSADPQESGPKAITALDG